MLPNQISGLSKFIELFNALKDAIKDLVNSLSNNPHKHPIIYVAIVTTYTGYLNTNNLDFKYAYSEILILLISVVFFYSVFYSFYPWVKTMVKTFFIKKEAIKYFSELTNEQKNFLLGFFPNPNVTRLIEVPHNDYFLRELIEYKILISDIDLYYDESTHCHFVNLNIAKYILMIIKKNSLLEVWQAELIPF
jgi:Super-infection exclusion protein B